MVQSDDIFRQINKKRKRTRTTPTTDDMMASILEDQLLDGDDVTESEEDAIVEEKEPIEEDSTQESDVDDSDEELDDHGDEDEEPEVADEPEPVKQEIQTTEVVGDVSIKNGRQTPVADVPVSRERPPETDNQTFEPEVQDVVSTVKHPEYERLKVHDDFKQLSVNEKLAFSDIFVKEDGVVVYNSEHEKSVARNLSKGVIDHVVEDLKNKHRNVRVSIGENVFMIRDTNSVFTTTTSLMRFLLLNSIDDDNTALQVARQLFLEKHPDGEREDFDHSRVRTDERDVYALLLSVKKDPERDLAEKVEELIRSVEYAQETTALTDRKILNYTEQSGHLLNGLNVAASLLVLDRLGLTKGSLPNTLDEVHGFITQDEIVKLSDLLGNDIASEVESRKRTLARDERAKRLSAREQRSAPRSSLRYSNRRGSEYDR